MYIIQVTQVVKKIEIAKDFVKKGNGPERIIIKAVRGMLPHTRLGDAIINNLKVYQGDKHNQEAQQPKLINLNDLR